MADKRTKINTQTTTNENEALRSVITILLLLFAYPVGLIVMWFWTKWKLWVKILITSLFVIIGIFTILLGVIFIAINPSKQFAKANNTKRYSDINAISIAVAQYMVEHDGMYPTGITTQKQAIAKNGADICSALVPNYIAGLPQDPLNDSRLVITDCSQEYNTQYLISVNPETNEITVSASSPETLRPISVTR